MYTVIDYVNYYKENSFKEYPFNENDALLLSILTYLPFPNKIDKITIKKLYNMYLTYDTNHKGIMEKVALRLLMEIRNSNRYGDMEFINIVNVVNKEYQFGAFVTRLDGKKIVCYKGTDDSIIGWKEDFRLSFDYLTKTQQVAIDYLKNIPFSYEKNVILLGHSKGGNLAVVTALNYRNFYNKVSKIYNFDGPGVPSNILKSKEWHNIKDKIINFVPENSIVGMLLNNENYIPVKTDGLGIKCHYLPNWYCFGTYLVKGELNKTSAKLHTETNKRLMIVDHDELRIVVEAFFDLLEKEDITSIKDLKSLSISKYKKIYKDIDNVSEETKEYFRNIIKIFFNIG